MSAARYLTLLQSATHVGGALVRAWHIKQWGVGQVFKTLPWNTAKFLFFDRELTNFTYELRNRDDLVRFLSDSLQLPQAKQYLEEIETDAEFRRMMDAAYGSRRDRNPRAKYGRRMGWYVIVRSLKPKVIFETGTHDGLGASIFARALQKNAKEGQRGTLYTFDIDPTSGWLVPAELRRHVGFVRGSVTDMMPKTLAQLGAKVDLFIHDSIHTYEHESWEIETVAPHVAPGGMILTDNAHQTDALKDFAAKKGFPFHYWREKPRAHPHPGGSIGAARVR
jgi:predicted O-methyltransferase YrrM